MDDQVQRTQAPPSDLAPDHAVKRDGPFWLAIALALGGGLYILFGRVTILPWISDERRRASIRHVWGELSRDLPDVGQPTLEKLGFWILIVATAALCAALFVLASNVHDGDEPGTGERA